MTTKQPELGPAIILTLGFSALKYRTKRNVLMASKLRNIQDLLKVSPVSNREKRYISQSAFAHHDRQN